MYNMYICQILSEYIYTCTGAVSGPFCCSSSRGSTHDKGACSIVQHKVISIKCRLESVGEGLDIQACALRQWSPVIGHRTELELHTDMQAGTETGHWTGGRLRTHMGLQSTQPFHSPRASDCSTHTAQPAGAHSIVQMCSSTHACDIIMLVQDAE